MRVLTLERHMLCSHRRRRRRQSYTELNKFKRLKHVRHQHSAVACVRVGFVTRAERTNTQTYTHSES